MITQELVLFIKQQLSLGMTHDQISQTLQANGWMVSDIQDGFNQVQPIAQVPLPVIQHPADTVSIQTPRKSRAGLVVGIIIGLLLLGGGAYAYMKYFAPTPEKTIARAMASFASAQSMKFAGTVTVHTDSGPGIKDLVSMSGLAAPVTSATSSATTTTTAAGYDGTIRFEGMTNLESSQSQVHIVDTGDNVEAEVRYVANTLYVKPTTTLIPIPSEWIALQTGDGDMKIPSPELTDEQKTIRDNFKKSVADGTAFTITETRADEQVGDVLSHHYVIAVNPKTLGTIPQEYADVIAKTPVHLWIGKTDGQIHRMTTDIQATADNISGTVGIDVMFSDFNTDISVDAPAGAKSFEEVMKALMTSMFSGLMTDIDSGKLPDGASPALKNSLDSARQSAEIAKTRAILSQMRAQAEIYYGQEGKNTYGVPNTKVGECFGSGTGSMFATTGFKKMIESVVGVIPDKTAIKCQATKSLWAVGAKLPDGKNFCVDATGFSGEIKSLATVNSGTCKF